METYEEMLRNPGVPITSGMDMFKEFGYTDIRNPIYSFDLMNSPGFETIENCLKNEREIPERCNANVIRLRNYNLGNKINGFRELCDSALTFYEEAWEEYREEYNPSMPESFYDFWMLYDSVLFKELLPKYINLIDPVSMKWIDPDSPKITLENDVYKFKLDEPIMTSDARFLYPDVEKVSSDPIISMYETISEEVSEFVPISIITAEILNNEFTHSKPKKGETEDEFIRRSKFEVRAWRKKKRRFTTGINR